MKFPISPLQCGEVGNHIMVDKTGLKPDDTYDSHFWSHASLRRLRKYLFEISFESYPEYRQIDIPPIISGCTSFVRDGKLYRNFDWDYTENSTFHVICSGFEGIGFLPTLNDSNFSTKHLAQLPYHLIDGRNDYGIMVAVHILYNDWNYSSSGSIPLSTVPYYILTHLTSMNDIESSLSPILSDLNTNVPGLNGYLSQYIITDGTTTYILTPPESEIGSYTLINATNDNAGIPRLTNFRWVSNGTVEQTADYMQTRPTGIERWNMIDSDTMLQDLKFTDAYVDNTRLSEFIGINDTTKDSTEEDLIPIFIKANEEYSKHIRNGNTWQTMHSVVYSGSKIESLFVQEDYSRDFSK